MNCKVIVENNCKISPCKVMCVHNTDTGQGYKVSLTKTTSGPSGTAVKNEIVKVFAGTKYRLGHSFLHISGPGWEQLLPTRITWTVVGEQPYMDVE